MAAFGSAQIAGSFIDDDFGMPPAAASTYNTRLDDITFLFDDLGPTFHFSSSTAEVRDVTRCILRSTMQSNGEDIAYEHRQLLRLIDSPFCASL